MGIFPEIPRHNRMDVLKKLEFKDFVKFRKCSQETVEMTKNFEHRLYLEMDKISFNEDFDFEKSGTKYGLERLSSEPIRLELKWIVVYDIMSEAHFCKLREFSQKTKLMVKKLCLYAFHQEDHNDAPMIDNLIKLLNVNSLHLESHRPSVLSSLNELKKIKEIEFTDGFMKECEFLLLEQPIIRIYDISPTLTHPAIVVFLKQWYEGKREIKHFSADVEGNFLEACNDLEISILWSPESPESKISLRNNGADEETKLSLVFSIEREMDKKKLFVVISEEIYSDQSLEQIAIEEYKEVKEIQEYIRKTFNVEDYCLPFVSCEQY